MDEIHVRHKSALSDNFISYREDSSNQSLSRVVAVLEPINPMPSRSPSGTTIIVGIDGIGIQMAGPLFQSGCGTIVFLGQNPEGHEVLILKFLINTILTNFRRSRKDSRAFQKRCTASATTIKWICGTCSRSRVPCLTSTLLMAVLKTSSTPPHPQPLYLLMLPFATWYLAPGISISPVKS